jgi:hypothetical protein
MIRVRTIESALESVAAAVFGGCLSYSLFIAAPVWGLDPVPLSLAAFAFGFLAAVRGLQVWGRPHYAVRPFAPAPLAGEPTDELLLTDRVILMPSRDPVESMVATLERRLGVTRNDTRSSDELLLDDVLTEAAPDSRVIQLFDPAAMPTPGELQSRIERRIENSDSANPDAAQSLTDALASLRRSLR